MSPVTVVVRRHYGLQPRDIAPDISSLPTFSVPHFQTKTKEWAIGCVNPSGRRASERNLWPTLSPSAVILLSQLPQ